MLHSLDESFPGNLEDRRVPDQSKKAPPVPSLPATVAMVCPLRRGIGIEDLVEAARLLRIRAAAERRRPPRILVAGATIPQDSSSLPERQLCDWHDDGMIQWRDFSDDPAVLFDAADVIVLPNLTAAEMTPYSRLREKRLIAFAGTDFRHERGLGGMHRTVPAGDPARLADAIGELIRTDADTAPG